VCTCLPLYVHTLLEIKIYSLSNCCQLTRKTLVAESETCGCQNWKIFLYPWMREILPTTTNESATVINIVVLKMVFPQNQVQEKPMTGQTDFSVLHMVSKTTWCIRCSPLVVILKLVDTNHFTVLREREMNTSSDVQQNMIYYTMSLLVKKIRFFILF